MGIDPETQLSRVLFESAGWDESGMRLEKVNGESLRDCSPPFKMSRFMLKPGARSPLDCHEDKEIWFIAAGKGELTRAGEEVMEISQGDIVELGSMVSHTLLNTGQDDLLVFSVWWI